MITVLIIKVYTVYSLIFLNLYISDASQKTSLKLVDNLLVDHDAPVTKMRSKVENIWKDGRSQRLRRTAATQQGAGGFSIFADNVGKVSIIFFF